MIDGAITDGYLPLFSDTSNPWIQLFKKIKAQYDPSAPWTAMSSTAWRTRTRSFRRSLAAGKDLTRQDLVNAVNNEGGSWTGPGLTPFRYTKTEHGGYSGVQMAKVVGTAINPFGPVLTTPPTAGSAITTYTGTPATPPASGIPTN